MAALCKRFEEPLADWKARDCIKTISYGCRVVAEYTQEFCDLTWRLNDWPSYSAALKDWLSDETYNFQGYPSTLHGWIVLAEEEIDLARNKHCPGCGW